MTRPSNRTMALGHLLVTVPAQMLGLYLLYVCWLGGSSWLVGGVLTVSGMLGIAEARKRRLAYLRWQREWEALAGPRARSGNRVWGYAGMVLGGLLSVAFIGSLGSSTSPTAMAVAWAVGIAASVVVFFVLRGAWRWFRTRPVRSTAAVVPVAIVARMIVPPLSDRDSFARLPDYCLALLEGPSQ